MLKKILIISILILLVTFSLTNCFAGGPPKGPPMGPPPCWPPPCGVPIDGGLSFLIAAGAALAGKKFYDARKK